MEKIGDVIIQGLWEIKTDAIIDVRFGDTDADTYEPMDKLLVFWYKENRDNSGNQLHEQRKHVYQFFLSVDGILGKEALVVLPNVSRLMAEKLEKPISHVCGCVNGRIAITVAAFYSHMIIGARLPNSLYN